MKMKKTGKKILLLCMAMLMVTGMTSTALAAEATGVTGTMDSAISDPLKDDGKGNPASQAGGKKIKANPTAAKVLVDGTVVEFEAYTIDGNNYFKLRDIAKIVSGSEKQFEVSWDSTKKAINLVSKKSYTKVGGELAKGDGKTKDAIKCTSTILKDGKSVDLKAYTINGNNYFKLRDLGSSFDFDVSWNSKENSIVIDTTKSYTAD